MDLRNQGRFFDYAVKNGQSWYRFVTGPLGRRIQNGSLYLVTGCDKSPAWGVASCSDPFGKTEVSLKFMAAESGKDGNSSSLAYSWEEYKSATVRTGADPSSNQCAFVRGFRISVQPGLIPWFPMNPLRRYKVKVEDGINPLPGQPYDPLSGKLYQSLSGKPYQPQPVSGQPYHPLVSINNYLLESVNPFPKKANLFSNESYDDLQVKGSEIAVTHDDDWHALLKEV